MICFAWHGFPQYAARCVGSFVKATAERVVVIATKPLVPIVGMERAVGCELIWIVDEDDTRDIASLCGEIPRVLFVAGWWVPAFNRYRDQVGGRGGRVVSLVDNNFRFSVRELIKAFRFRMFLRRKYDGYLVPGASGRRLLRFYGVSDERIRNGLYSADETLFTCSKPMAKRVKKILFVGQLNARKNIVPFARAFLKANNNREWVLEICGCGPDKMKIPKDATIIVHDFVQPEELAGIYQSARVFALPSLEEHWGVVVHEAALSGCILLLSDRIGAAVDFGGPDNSVSFNPFSEDEMASAIKKSMALSDDEMLRASKESVKLGAKINKRLFVCSVFEFAKA